MKKAVAILAALILGAFPVLSAAAAEVPYDTYTYDNAGQVRLSPHACLPEETVRLENTEAGGLKNPMDIFAAPDGRVYIADTENNRIVVLKEDLSFDEVILQIPYGEETLTLNRPEGVFVTEDGSLFIADTANARVVVLNPDRTARSIINAPKANVIPEDFIFKPAAVAVDELDRIYIVSRDMNLGIMAMSEDGSFDGFLGAQKVVPDLWELFWRNFATEEMIDRTTQFVPTEYNNLALDEKGFVYVTTNSIDQWMQYSSLLSKSSSGDYAPIRKLNASGTDILRRAATYPPAGDLVISDAGPSSIIDVASGPNGIYTLLDTRMGRFFTYDENGALLYAFGGSGNDASAPSLPVSIVYQGTTLLALDKTTGGITAYPLTQYGEEIQQALSLYRNRKYKEAAEAWAGLISRNNNLDLGYRNLGNTAYQQEDYLSAMEYYRIAQDSQGYSNAFRESRKEWMNQWFLMIPVAAIVLVVLLSFAAKGIRLSVEGVESGRKKNNLPRQLLYSFRTLTHPLASFDEIKRDKRIGVGAATCLLAATVLAILCGQLFTGFQFRAEEPYLDLVTALASVCGPMLLFCVANWCLSTLTDGKGRLKEIYITACVSLLPLVLTLPIGAILSNILTLEESVVYSFLTVIGAVWFAFQLFCGILVIHDYSVLKNVITILLTILGMAIILFLGILFINLISEMIGFIRNLITEISLRFG
ncbi:MAG: YIP1 family protein [Oscillospiraceae bacterium]|nr:YIP1 family protein [Oscillospiraceae bacterium]